MNKKVKEAADKWKSEVDEMVRVKRYLLTEIPNAFYKRIRVRAIEEDLTINHLVQKAVRFYLDNEK